MNSPGPKRRIIYITAGIITILCLLAARVYKLQMEPTEKVQSSYQNHQQEDITNLNYKILDTNNEDLIKYDKKYIMVIDLSPFKLNNYEETLEDLMALNFIMKSEDPDFNYSEILKQGSGKVYFNISESTCEKIKQLENIKGIYVYESDTANEKKAWSIGNMFSRITEEENEDGTLNEKINEYVKDNKKIQKQFFLDEKAVYAKEEIYVPDENKNLKLTIDKNIQEKVEDVIKSDKYSRLKNIGVTIVESNTGKIRCMTQKDESEADINLCIGQMGYEPGSIYKLITLATSLECGKVNVSDQYTCRQKICKTNHGTMSLEKALSVSCNDIFAQIGNETGYENLIKYSKDLGLFSPVLNYGNADKKEAEGTQPEEDAGINNISIGQCMNVTPIQMAGAVNAIVNNGVYKKPYIVEAIVDKDNNIIEEFKTKTNKIYSETTSKMVQNAMTRVVKEGTGKNAYIEGENIGGKTGSATGNNNTTHGWFAGFFENDGIKYTMVVFTPDIEDIKNSSNNEAGGGDTAAPIFKNIVENIVS